MVLPSTGHGPSEGIRDFEYPEAGDAIPEEDPSSHPSGGPAPNESQPPVEVDLEEIHKQAFQEGYAAEETAG